MIICKPLSLKILELFFMVLYLLSTNVFKNWFRPILLIINPFVPTNASFFYPLKISENRMIFWCFQGVEKGCIGNKWVNVTS